MKDTCSSSGSHVVPSNTLGFGAAIALALAAMDGGAQAAVLSSAPVGEGVILSKNADFSTKDSTSRASGGVLDLRRDPRQDLPNEMVRESFEVRISGAFGNVRSRLAHL